MVDIPITRARRLRGLAGMSATQLATRAGISRQVLWVLERSGWATPEVAAKVAAALGVSPTQVLGPAPRLRSLSGIIG